MLRPHTPSKSVTSAVHPEVMTLEATEAAVGSGSRGRRRRRQVVVGGDGDRCWSPPNRDDESATVEAVEAGLVGGGGGRNDGELATRGGAKRGRWDDAVRGEAVVKAVKAAWTQQRFARWKATTMTGKGDGFGGGGETGSEEDEGRRCGCGAAAVSSGAAALSSGAE
ncbi:hypothetical protein Scep_019873 [Stephania cephalantha]|uniref:Uncharacterized protein n=1 Tax=Stephania cephalantha TaxID=152367 RepID=A0AAP0IBG8_9MAGN